MVKRKKLKLRNFDARHGKIETGAVVKNRTGLSGVEGGKGICYHWKEKGQCSKGKQCSFRHESNERAQKRTPNAATLSEPSMSRGRSVSRKRSIRGKRNQGAILRQPCKYHLKGTCTRSLCEFWRPPECQFFSSESGCKFGTECSFPHWRVEAQPNKSPKKGGDKSAVGIMKDVRQLGCVSQDAEPPESSAILRRGTKILGPIRRVRCTRVYATSSKYPGKERTIAWKNTSQRSPSAVTFEDRSHGDTERQQRCARSKAWNLAKNIYKLKEK